MAEGEVEYGKLFSIHGGRSRAHASDGDAAIAGTSVARSAAGTNLRPLHFGADDVEEAWPNAAEGETADSSNKTQRKTRTRVESVAWEHTSAPRFTRLTRLRYGRAGRPHGPVDEGGGVAGRGAPGHSAPKAS